MSEYEARLAKHMAAKPERPADGECCGSGCSPCIYDYYYQALARWQAQAPSPPKDPVDPTG